MSSPWEKLAENRIQEAIENGDLQPPAAGTPLDLSDYFSQPATERMGLSILKGAGVIPPEIELLKAVAALENELAACTDSRRAAALRDELQQRRVSLAMTMERRKRRDPSV